MDRKARELRAQGSHPDAPSKKLAAVESGVEGIGVPNSDDMEEEIDVQQMFWSMMTMIKKVEKDVSDVKGVVGEAKGMAERAVAEVKELKQQLNEDVERIDSNVSNIQKDTAQTKEKLSALQSEVLQLKEGKFGGPVSRLSAGSGGKGSGKGSGKDDGKGLKRLEERKRTLIFTNFPDDTQEDDIIKAIRDKIGGSIDDVEDVFTFSKTGTKGAAKFNTEDLLWKYMKTNKGEHTLHYEGNRIYVAAGVPEDEKKERAVRKVVRLLIENNGGNGEQIKKKIDAKYRWGAVWWQGEDDK